MKRIFVALCTLVWIYGCSPHTADLSEDDAAEQELLLHVPSPEWQDQVIYFLMTDRFSDGDPTNNDQGVGVFDPTKESHYSGGDIQGVIDQLDYIENLGATAVWTTPLVANQWWSSDSQYGGYHGYWATDFSAVDAHVGTMETYKMLSDQLHRRGMYLIQDIVVNHTGNFFNYKGGLAGYDASDTAKNFMLLENPDSMQPGPTQHPFDLIDRLNPDHVTADIYNWTPSIMNYSDQSQQYRFQLSTLADINTTNPIVIDTFKQIYGDWIRNVGVDAFRIDTVRYVEHSFFHHFMHDQDGIHQAAKATGRDNFLAFGEVFETSKPYSNDAEYRVASYLGNEQTPELNSLISFPLHHDLKTVFAQGLPTDHLAYRIQQHMDVYQDPYIIPTFIDNHDMSRFLASGDIAGFKQALATIFTIPGIPTLYQGTAQGMTESRQAMFAGGFLSDKDYFDQDTELYKFIQALSTLRTSDKIFTRGDLTMIASNKTGPGIFAYTRRYQGREVLVMFNSSRNDILVSDILVSDQPANLRTLFGSDLTMSLNNQGKLTTELPGRSVVVAEIIKIGEGHIDAEHHISISTPKPHEAIDQDIVIEGQSSLVNTSILLIKNSRLDTAQSVETNSQGHWQFTYPVVNLGEESVSLVAYAPSKQLTSEAFTFSTIVSAPKESFSIADKMNDDTGLNGNITPPQHSQSIGQMDIIGVDAQIGGEVLTLTLTMKELTDDWIPANGFDNVAFSIFIDLADQQGARVLPMLDASMPNDWHWDLGHVSYGWGNTTFSPLHATAEHQGQKFGIAPQVDVNKHAKTVRFTYRASDFDVSTWLASKLFITTWDITGEGAYRGISPQANQWNFGGGEDHAPKILDFVELTLTP